MVRRPDGAAAGDGGQDALSPLVAEIRQEQASALGDAGRALAHALVMLGDAGAATEERIAQAAERLWYLVIQREACGLTRHDDVYTHFAVPAVVRRRMGARPRTSGS